ncbi:MAG TPA: RICIN domain-containing protein [Trebonia sp.]|nr:RICIN domain-containing protein [Trebonia sp.]
MKIKLPTSRTARLSAVLAGVAVPALVASTALAGPASASTEFTVHITPDNTLGLLLDVSGASTQPGAPVIDWYADGGANQEWTFLPDGGTNTYEIINANSGQCLTTDGVAGDQLYQLPCAGGPIQQWQTAITPGQEGVGTIRNVSSGLYVDVSGDSPWPGAAIDTWYYNGQDNQYFGPL